MMKKYISNFFSITPLSCIIGLMTMMTYSVANGQESAKEEDYFKIMKVSVPEGVLLEVGGLYTLPNGDKSWHGIWLTFAIYALIVAVLFGIFFRHKHVPSSLEIKEGESVGMTPH